MFLAAIEPTTVLAMDYQLLQSLYQYSKNGERLGRINAEQLFIQKELREASLMLDSPDERFLFLMQQKKEWFQRVPQYLLASYLNISPETLSRIKKRNMKSSRRRS